MKALKIDGDKMSIGSIVNRLIEPKVQIDEDRKLFSNLDLKRLIVPLIIEQMLTMMVGLVDTMMISYAGEAAVSGVSLVDMINGLFIFVFSALATGGAVIVSQYIGNKDKEKGCYSASQLITITAIVSILFMAIALLFNGVILDLMLGGVEAEVMNSAKTYFYISALSYPLLAVYSGGTAIFRSMKKAKVTMYVSILMNVINVVGNYLGIFVFNAGVTGIAIASLVSRLVATIIMIYLALDKKNVVYVTFKQILSVNIRLVKQILYIAVPNGIENGLFQLSKLILVSMIALFGTSHIVANGVANSIDYVGAIIGTGINLGIVTVVGQCIGAKDYEQVDYYIKKLLRIAYVFTFVLDIAIILAMPLILQMFSLSVETARITFILVVIHNLFVITISPLSGPLSSALRAAGDVKYTMYISIFATVICRVVFSYLFGIVLNLGIVGVWIAMGFDWGIRAVLFVKRYKSEVWKEFDIIGK